MIQEDQRAESYLLRCLQAGICVHVQFGLKVINRGFFFLAGEGCGIFSVFFFLTVAVVIYYSKKNPRWGNNHQN